MYKEVRDLSRAAAVASLYQDMAARHRARFRSIQVCLDSPCSDFHLAGDDLSTLQILRVQELEKTSDVRRPYIKQLLTPKLRFPLPRRITKANGKFAASRPKTF